jgi:tetratricopeptide (TPR) repeat protein
MPDPAAQADDLIRSAVEMYRQGNAAEAEAQCRQALALAPRHTDGLVLLGLVLHFEGRYGEAEEIFAELTRLAPEEPSHWINLGTARHGSKRFDDALTAYARAAELGAASADFYCSIGLVHFDRCDFESARSVLARAAQLGPEYAEIRYHYAQACYECLQTEEALKALEGWERLPDLTSEVAANIGHLLMSLGDSARAELALQEAALDPAPKPEVTLTIVQALERTNRLSEARSLFDSLSADPRASSLGRELTLTQARLAARESQHETAARLLEQALTEVNEFHQRHYQLFPLAKSLDALHRYDAAFETLLEAHRSQAAHIALAPAVALRGVPNMTITRFGCDPADVAGWDHENAPSAAESPVFVVGFPRSGTTLLELALDAHPLLASMDEQPFLQNALDDLRATGASYPGGLAALSRTDLERIRTAYWGRVRGRVLLEPGQRLVDKNPLNILRLPVIRRLFPHSRILLTVRHPCDVLLSCYVQHFRAPDFALLCGDLPSLAAGYRRTFDFWYEQVGVLAPNVCEVRYETFVADLDAEARRVIDYLDLPWADRVLAPAERAQAKGYISTPSYAQVVQPVNTKSIGRWRAYEQRFVDIIPLVRPYLDRWHYDA